MLDQELTIKSPEFYNLIAMFERDFARVGRLDKEPKDFWAKGNIYQNGEINCLFLAFRKGYSFCRSLAR